MLGRQYRLKKNRDFRFIYRRGKSLAARTLALAYYRTNKPNELLFGFSASKKVGNAVVRNRVKRLMRENARLRIDQIPPGYRLIFTARVAAASADYDRIGKDMDYLLKKSGLIKKGSD